MGLKISLVLANPRSKYQRVRCLARREDSRRKTGGLRRAYHGAMALLDDFASAFFKLFGITQPSDQKRRRTAWFLVGMLAVIVIGLCLAGTLILHLMQN